MAYLRIFTGNTLLEQHALTSAHTTIGRAADNDIVLRSGGVSKHHAVIVRDGADFILRDAGSANGLFIAGRRIYERRLQFWDEIQIVDYVLKFMAVARLKGEEAGTEEIPTRAVAQEATMELDISGIHDLLRLKRARQKAAGPDVRQAAQGWVRYPLNKITFTIGRAGDNDLQLGGWLAPRLAASIQRRSDGFYLMPARRGKVSINGHRTWQQVKLNDGDDVRVRGLAMTFSYRSGEQR